MPKGDTPKRTPGRSEHVGEALDIRAAERFGENLLSAFGGGSPFYQASRIQMYLGNRAVTDGHRPFHYDACDIRFRQDGHIHAIRLELPDDIHTVGQAPVRFSGAAVNYQLHGVTLQHFEEFDLEDEGGAGRDAAVGAGLAISELIRDVELVDGALGHELETFGPSGDDLVKAEDGRFASVVRTVELHTAGERTLIMAADTVGTAGLAAFALL